MPKQEQIQKPKHREELPEIEELPEPVDVSAAIYAANLLLVKIEEVL